MKHIFIASSNPGKLRDFAAVATKHGVQVDLLPEFKSIPEAIEDGITFEENARKKAEHYSRYAPGQVILADDSGLAVDYLGGEPGVRSARYAALTEHGNSDDDANNSLLLQKMAGVSEEQRGAEFVCVIAIAKDGTTLETFRGAARGQLLNALRGNGGFGYDPLFYFPSLGKTFAELSPQEKAGVSHRGAAFEKFLAWCDQQPNL